MTTPNPSVIFLMGPTASGKSALAMALAENISVELISVDATQVYRGLDIGSAKPSTEEQQRVAHHLIDIRDPAEPYSAAEFCRDAQAAINSIIDKGKTPLLVGGTMLYYRALLEGLADLPEGDEAMRADIAAEAEKVGWPAMHQQLADIDPETAARLHPNHSQRIARAIEVYRLCGQTLSELHRQQQSSAVVKFADQYNVYQLALVPEREKLHRDIDQRFEQMLEQGLEVEVRELQQRGDLNLELPSMRAVGYRQMWQYLAGDIDFEVMKEKGKAATRQLAKRQMTWLRSWDKLLRLDLEDNQEKPLKIEQIRDQALNCLTGATI